MYWRSRDSPLLPPSPRTLSVLDELRIQSLTLVYCWGLAGLVASQLAAIVLDRDGAVVMSVVRSGRLSAKGSMNACAKEIAMKLAVLRK